MPSDTPPQAPGRRGFLRAGALTLASATLGPRIAGLAHARPAAGPLFRAMGIAAPITQAAELKAQGAGFLTENVGRLLVPDQPEEVFAPLLAAALASPLPILACNSFIRPAHLRCVGPDANHDLVLEWAESAFARLRRVGGKFIVFGSNNARRLNDGWTKEQADPQFIALLRRMGPLAARHGVTVVVEQLRKEECNYLNHLGEGAAIIRAVGHPHIRMLADLFHMASVGDTPADLAAAMDVVDHIEIAELSGRTVPGVNGDDFRPWFRVLREARYAGAVSIEGRWEMAQVGRAFEEITRQAAEA